ncbi:MAG: 5-methylcytosine restriction system specificity protein McrC [Lentisphaeria bacterium]
MITSDNNCGKNFSELGYWGREITDREKEDLEKIANCKISNLENSRNLLIFPHSLSQTRDKIQENLIFSLDTDKLITYNIMGFIGVNETQLTIRSRFATGEKDYFLHYMLQKVFSINLFDLKHQTEEEEVFDFLLYLFPLYLKKALRQGIFKEYQQRHYNDANVRGNIEVNRHIRQNIPFAGKVAYRTREHSFDNSMTQLVRHTIEHIKKHPWGKNVLSGDVDTENSVSQIIAATNSYHAQHRLKIIQQNLRPLQHPYFFEYLPLQKICLQILRREGMKYGREKDQIYGFLFEGAWLWEEYLNTILSKEGFTHPENKKGLGRISLFEDGSGHRYPDFYKAKNIVLDAKYKRLENAKKVSSVDNNDLHQVVTYMFILLAKKGGFVFPVENEKQFESKLATLNGYGGIMKLFGLIIPNNKNSFKDFCTQIQNSENNLIREIDNFHNICENQISVTLDKHTY